MKKVTVDLGDTGLYRDIRLKAVEAGRPVREVIIEALQEWLHLHKKAQGDE